MAASDDLARVPPAIPRDFLSALDGAAFSMYLVEPQTYHLVYMNQALRRLCGASGEGQRCYQALAGRSSPCGDCPIAALLEGDGESVPVERRHGGGWQLSQASRVCPGGRALYMVGSADISAQKAEEERLRAGAEERERARMYEEAYRIALGHVNGLVYRFDIGARTAFMPPDVASSFNMPHRIENVPDGAIDAGYIAPESVEAYRDFYRTISQGIEGKTLELRRRLCDGSYRWFKGAYTIIRAGDGSPSAAVVTFEDIEDDLLRRAQLMESAAQDSMTGLLNHAAMEQRVEACLKNASAGLNCAMLMLDIDNFKDINDSLGHQRGDEALVRVARLLRSSFRDSDLVGRIGGDEFMVFIPAGIDAAGVRRKAEALLEALRVPDGELRLTVSIGGTLGGSDASFHRLYGEADSALYQAKRAGKNAFCLCSRA